jgi:hypothetical protein
LIEEAEFEQPDVPIFVPIDNNTPRRRSADVPNKISLLTPLAAHELGL